MISTSYDAETTGVDASNTSSEMLPANGRRKGVIVHNATEGSAYVRFGDDDAGTDYGEYTYAIPAGGTWEMRPTLHLGAIQVICEVSQGGLSVTEQT